MTVALVRGTNDKPVSSQALINFFSADSGHQGHFFLGYPIIPTAEGRHAIDALLISPTRGIILFDLVEGSQLDDYVRRQDDAANKLDARLRNHRELMVGRELSIPIHTISFAPAANSAKASGDNEHPVANLETLKKALSGFRWTDKAARVYESTLSAIQSISTIRKSRTKRSVKHDNSRGARLKGLEDSIATLDNLQSKAVIETVDHVQRIRGLAGSGKTIVLALKAAYLHAQHPDWRIAVTFNTRSLKGQFRRLINNFCIEQTGDEPDWEQLRIVNAWGAPGGIERDGIYHEFCRANDIEYLDFRGARSAFGRDAEFAGACELALRQVREQGHNPKQLYQAMLVDEAQDFPPDFLRLCYEQLDDLKRLVYAYDELQNLSGNSLPPPEEIFGLNPEGSPRESLGSNGPRGPQRDIILEKCYRNSRPLLVTAHALGFGIYRDSPKPGTTGLVQMFEDAHLWEDIGYRKMQGQLKDGAAVVLARTEETSPSFLESHSPIDDLVQFECFESDDEQNTWLLEAIKRNIEVDELRHDDIVVINPDPVTTRERVGPVRRRLLEIGINSHLAGVDTDPDVFFKADVPSVTFTGIYRAKGNEAGMVYIVNAHDCHSAAWNLASIRNRLFTAITRSKAWVRVAGVGIGMKRLIEEYERLKAKQFELRFKYPTKEERKQLMIVHRDMSAAERKRVEDRERGLIELIADLESGKIHPEDLSDDLKSRLRDLLRGRS